MSTKPTQIYTFIAADLTALLTGKVDRVWQWGDMSESAADGTWVGIEIAPRERLQPNYSYYKSRINLHCGSYITDDKNRDSVNAILEVCDDYIRTLVAGSIGCDGVVEVPGTDNMDGTWHGRTVSFEAFYTDNGTALVTTA